MYKYKNDGLNTETKKVNSTLPIIFKISIIIFSLMALCISFFLYSSYNTKNILSTTKKYELESEWKQVELLIHENILKSNIANSIVVSKIVNDISKNYSDAQVLKNDIESPKNNTKLSEILNSNIYNKYLNGIKNENNSMFIITDNLILADNIVTENLSKGKRTLNSEIANYRNKDLASEAFKKLTSRSKKLPSDIIYIENSKSKSNIDNININLLKEQYLKEGINSLKNIKFLVPGYILKDKDILGIPDSDVFGVNTKNNKIIVVQRFNIYDIITTKYSTFTSNNHYYIQIESKIETLQTILRITIILSIFFLLIALLSLNVFLNKQKQIIENSFIKNLEDYEIKNKINKKN